MPLKGCFLYRTMHEFKDVFYDKNIESPSSLLSKSLFFSDLASCVCHTGKPSSIRELKDLFMADAKKRVKDTWEDAGASEADAQAQSYVRNGIRRLIRDGWAEGPAQNEKCVRGTYQLSRAGKDKVRRKVTVTCSAKESQPKKKVVAKKKAAPKKKVVAKRAAAGGQDKATTEAAAKARAKKKTSAKKVVAKPKKSNGVKAKKGNGKKVAAKKSDSKQAKEKAAEAARRAAKAAGQEKAEAVVTRAAAATE